MEKHYSTHSGYTDLAATINRIPGDEPFIILRASQVGSPQALTALRSEIIGFKAHEGDHAAMDSSYEVRDLAEHFSDWQKRNPDKLGTY